MNIAVSRNFKKMTTRAIISIIFFILVYILLLAFAVALTIACAYLGISIIIAMPRFITLALGIGLASLGVFILIFLFKFMFKRHTVDRSHLTEIKEEDEPQLFSFIRDIVAEVDTTFPKKIYLSSDVNASVFYDSSFWSMFFPIRKNLQIGMGLVNTISQQEFKAILAHEFGHFSQRSMKVGSYVYNVNKVIYNMLYDNDSYGNLISTWSGISGYFSIFVYIAVKIITAIQWILGKVYNVVNLSYMALSREMEFHADEVAANVAGYEPLRDSLRRLDLANHSFNTVLNYYGNKIEDNIKSRNIFREQQIVMHFLAKENQLAYKNNLPLITNHDINKYHKSKLNIKDQWASHPSTEERVEALEKTGITIPNVQDKPAVQLFTKPEQTEESLTQKLFSAVEYKGSVSDLDISKFENDLITDYEKNIFPKIFNSYYDNRNPTPIDLISLSQKTNTHTLDDLFNNINVNMTNEYTALKQDISILEAIIAKSLDASTFDYDGKKYKSKDAPSLIGSIEKDAIEVQEKLKVVDENIYIYFHSLAKAKGVEAELTKKYEDFYEVNIHHTFVENLYNECISATNFIRVTTPFDQIDVNFKKFLQIEQKLKNEIGSLLNDRILKEEINAGVKENLNQYISKDWVYFTGEMYDNTNLEILFKAINNYYELALRKYFLIKLDLLNFQARLTK